MSAASTRDRGLSCERIAAAHLERHGLEIIETNARAAGGELDIVARDRGAGGGPDTLVFVEVRSRTRIDRGEPIETIGPSKRRHLIRAATGWLVAHGLWEKVAVRFDVIGVVATPGDGPQITWITGAFEVA